MVYTQYTLRCVQARRFRFCLQATIRAFNIRSIRAAASSAAASSAVASIRVEKWRRTGTGGIEETKLCNVAWHSVVVWLVRAIKGLGEP